MNIIKKFIDQKIYVFIPLWVFGFFVLLSFIVHSSANQICQEAKGSYIQKIMELKDMEAARFFIIHDIVVYGCPLSLFEGSEGDFSQFFKRYQS